MKNSTWGAQLPFINWESISEQHQPIKDSVTLSNPETGHLSEQLEYGSYNNTDDCTITMTIQGDDNRHNLGVDNEADTGTNKEPDNNDVESFRLPTSTPTRSSSVKCYCRDMNR